MAWSSSEAYTGDYYLPGGKSVRFCALWETAVRTRIPKHSLPYALSFASCFTVSKLFAVLISLHICSSMPMVHVYYLSKATHT